MSNKGRYFAHYNGMLHPNKWEVRIIDKDGYMALPAEGPIVCTSYTECLQAIKRLEAGKQTCDEAILRPKMPPISIRKEIYEMLQREARRRNTTIQALVAHILDHFFDEERFIRRS